MEPYCATMKAIIQKIGYDIDIVELEIPEEHIHIVVRSVPKQSPSIAKQPPTTNHILITTLNIVNIITIGDGDTVK